MNPDLLAANIRLHLPASLRVHVSGNNRRDRLFVRVEHPSGQLAYNLVITNPNGPISAENIAKGALHVLGKAA